MGTYRISQVAEMTGVPATTLRYYEQEGLLPAARTPAGYRSYTDGDADRVRFISAAKHLGLPLDEIRSLLAVWDGGMCREIRDGLRPKVTAQITAVEHRIADLLSFRDRLNMARNHLWDLPARDEPCDPACAFLHHLPGDVPTTALHPRAAPRTTSSQLRSTAAACALGSGHYQERLARWQQILGDAPRSTAPGGGLTVRLPAARAAELTELVVAEQECCPFFDFQLTFAGPDVELTARASGGAVNLVEELFATRFRFGRGTAGTDHQRLDALSTSGEQVKELPGD